MVQRSSICVVFSGKRKSGKDYTVNHLTNLLQSNHLSYLVVRISEPIKSYFAEHYGLNLSELLSSNEYKENYRKQMISWMEQEIKQDPYVFIRKSLLESTRRHGISQPAGIIISDARRVNDIEYPH
uniref:Phosphomevalonate kinase n=1 Tax=Schistosoma japonicum TaxID=6182 RepID=Q86E53_SCHJA|nr:similar to GenBank Accession Number AP001507 tRNA/rRNA methyltransferase in Bacillus halodurans [Schistosoma japonicum]